MRWKTGLCVKKQRQYMSKDLFDALKEGVVTVEFTKLDTGELRVMPMHLIMKYPKQRLEIKN